MNNHVQTTRCFQQETPGKRQQSFRQSSLSKPLFPNLKAQIKYRDASLIKPASPKKSLLFFSTFSDLDIQIQIPIQNPSPSSGTGC